MISLPFLLIVQLVLISTRLYKPLALLNERLVVHVSWLHFNVVYSFIGQRIFEVT